MGSQRAGHDWATFTDFYHKGKMQLKGGSEYFQALITCICSSLSVLLFSKNPKQNVKTIQKGNFGPTFTTNDAQEFLMVLLISKLWIFQSFLINSLPIKSFRVTDQQILERIRISNRLGINNIFFLPYVYKNFFFSFHMIIFSVGWIFLPYDSQFSFSFFLEFIDRYEKYADYYTNNSCPLSLMAY